MFVMFIFAHEYNNNRESIWKVNSYSLIVYLSFSFPTLCNFHKIVSYTHVVGALHDVQCNTCNLLGETQKGSNSDDCFVCK